MGSLEGTVVVIPGAARGIGRAMAEDLDQGGATVAVNYVHSKGSGEELVAQLHQNGSPESIAIQADVSDPEQTTRRIEEAVKKFGRIDVLVNNAGINIDRSMKNLTAEDWNKVIQNDLSGSFYTVKAALPYFIQQKGGKIINISSMNALVASFGQANYSAAKAGVIGFTKTAALELARYIVTVNVIYPGWIGTDMWESMPDKVKEGVLTRIPLGRVGAPHEIA